MTWEELIQLLFQTAEPYLRVRGDMEHTRNAYENALVLLELEGGDPGVVLPAVILHDVGWSALRPEQIKKAFGVRAVGDEARRLNRIHETEGARLARRILEEIQYNPALIDRIEAIIERHDSGTETDSIEEKIVKDADKLWRVSKEGFWREQKRQGVSPRELLRHRMEYLDQWFITPSAARLAHEEARKRADETGHDD